MAKTYKHRMRFTYEGKTYNIYADTQRELAEKHAKKLQELKEGTKLYTGGMTVADWTEKAIEVYKSSNKNVDNMLYQIRKHILSEIGDRPIGKVTPLECQEILNNQIGMSYSHINKIFIELKFIFSSARKNGLITKDPTEDLVKPSAKKVTRRSLTPAEEKHFLEVAEDPRFLVFALMYHCGCRPGEAIAAEGQDIKDNMLHIRGTKTENADRYVPIPKEFLPRIAGTKPFEPIAPNNYGNHHTKSSYTRATHSLERALNISMGTRIERNKLVPPYALADDFVPYCLRHTYCTNLYKMGVKLKTAQKLMGHANIAMTADIYTHVDSEDIEEAAELIDKFRKSM